MLPLPIEHLIGVMILIAIIFNGFILVYMFAKPVKAYFGRMSSPAQPVNATTAAA